MHWQGPRWSLESTQQSVLLLSQWNVSRIYHLITKAMRVSLNYLGRCPGCSTLSTRTKRKFITSGGMLIWLPRNTEFRSNTWPNNHTSVNWTMVPQTLTPTNLGKASNASPCATSPISTDPYFYIIKARSPKTCQPNAFRTFQSAISEILVSRNSVLIWKIWKRKQIDWVTCIDLLN
jgi:hypothetical protein